MGNINPLNFTRQGMAAKMSALVQKNKEKNKKQETHTQQNPLT